MLALKVNQYVFKLKHCEYWPMWIYYLPVWIQHIWLSLKVGNIFFFLKTNPAIEGFILSDSKYKTLELVPNQYKPKAVFVKKTDTYNEVINAMNAKGVVFPIILKPDIGFRGLKVVKVDDEKTLKTLLSSVTIDYIIQEFASEPLEIGLFYYRFPGQKKGVIPSLTIKNYLSIVGNGADTLNELIQNNPRAILHQTQLEVKFKNRMNSIIPKGEKIVLEIIGNHNKGTEFLNGNHLIDDDLLAVFDELSHSMEGFYFGRFDIKTTSLQVLKEEKRFKILEVNGVGGEPTHIYDPQTPFIKVWKDLCSIWRVAAKIAKHNFNRGVKKPSLKEGYRLWKMYADYKTKLA